MQCLSLKRVGKPASRDMPPAVRKRSRVRFQIPPAVADEEAPERPAAVADDGAPERPNAVVDHADDDSDSVGYSIAGDTVDSETDGDADERASSRQQRLAPKTPVQGNPERSPSSKYNSQPEVGNFGMLLGNRGLRVFSTLWGFGPPHSQT